MPAVWLQASRPVTLMPPAGEEQGAYLTPCAPLRRIWQHPRPYTAMPTPIEHTTPALTRDKLNSVDFRWYVVRTLPHQERKLASMLGDWREHEKNLLEVYCPTHTAVSVSRGGRRAQVPLFAGYVFVLATHEALDSFIASSYPAGTILYDRRHEPGQRARLLTIPEGQMRFFMDFNENYAERVLVLERPYSDYAFNPKTGEPNEIVRVADGPLAGREGYLTRFRGERRLVFNMKSPTGGASFAVSIPDVWNFRVVRLHNAEGDRLTRATEKERAADLLIGLLQGSGMGGDVLPMFHAMVEALAAKPSLRALCHSLRCQGHDGIAARLATLTAAEAGLLVNLARYEHDNPGYTRSAYPRLVIRPFLTPTPGVAIGEEAAEARLAHTAFTEVIRKVDITEQAYYPSRQQGAAVTTTYYAHIGIMPTPPSHGGGERTPHHGSAPSHHGREPERGFTLFANWDAFLGQYFLTAGKANEKLVGGTERTAAGNDAAGEGGRRLLDSFRNYAPTLYTVLTDAASPVKAVRGLDVGGSKINAMAITATAATTPEAARTLTDTCTAICREVNTTTHLALWRRYLRTVWLHT